MASRAGRAAIIAASFGVQVLIFAGIAGLAADGSHAETGYAAPQGTSPATLTNGSMVISMSMEGQNATVRIPDPRTGMVSSAVGTNVLDNAQFAVQPGVDATMRITVSLPAGYPADSLTFEIVQDSFEYGAPPVIPEFPWLTVSQPGPGSHDYQYRWAGSQAGRGGWWQVVSIKWHGVITRVAFAEFGT